MPNAYFDDKPATPQEAFAHHGVKGMKWGVRKRDDKSSRKEATPEVIAKREKKAQVYDEQAKQAQAIIDRTKAKTTKYKFVQNQRDAQVRELEQFRDARKQDAKDVREGRLTAAQKKRLLRVGIVGGALVAYGTYKYLDSGQGNALAIRGREFATGKKHEWKKNDGLKGDLNLAQLHESVVRPVNPGFGEPGTKMNCRRCTFAYEMRRRGYDVKATKSVSATGQTPSGMLNATTPGLKLHTTTKTGMLADIVREGMNETKTGVEGPLTVGLKSSWGKNKIGDGASFADLPGDIKATSIFKALGQQPDGARGELGVGWGMGGGHSMAYEIVRGKPVIFDNQSGDYYDSPAKFVKFAENVTAAGHTRLDNVELNQDFLRRWLQDA